MRRIKMWMIAAILFCGTAAGLISCTFVEDNPVVPPTPDEPKDIVYNVELFGDDDVEYVSLEGFWDYLGEYLASIGEEDLEWLNDIGEDDLAWLDKVEIENELDWLNVELTDYLDANGDPVVRIALAQQALSRAQSRTEQTVTAEQDSPVKIKMQDGTTYIIKVTNSGLPGGDKANNFLTDWYLFDTVDLYFENGGTRAIYAPWTDPGGANIPLTIRRENKPWKGWEMAFCFCNDTKLKRGHYFGLYNKYTGQMRVYFYIDDPTGWGNDLCMHVFFGEGIDKIMYPLYNNLEFGIPNNHEMGVSLIPNAKLVNGQTQTFESWYTPFSENPSLEPGWHCFEFDMSGYVPEGKDWLNESANTVRFKIYAITQTKLGVSLKTTLMGNLDGTFRDQEIVQKGGANATSGIFSALGGLLTGVGGGINGKIESDAKWAYLMNAGVPKPNPAAYWGGFACNFVGGVLSGIGSLLEDPITYDTIPGKINLTLNATADTEGSISGTTPNSLASLVVGNQAIKNANPNSSVGQGVWGLADDPVIYVDKEDLLSTQSSIPLATTQMAQFANTNLRMVYALDPTSVKVCLNEKLFKFTDFDTVSVTTNVAVLVNNDYGHTDVYRKMLTLDNRPTFNLAGENSMNVTLNGSTTPAITEVGLDELADGDYETRDNCSIFAYKKDGKDWFRFHGRIIDAPEYGKKIIVEPQVFVPYTVDGSKCTVDNVTVPDFVVRVDVVFSATVNGQKKYFNFGKCFIPKIKLVGYEEMKGLAQNLKEYAEKCADGKPVNTLYHNSQQKSSKQVYHPNGEKYIGKSLRALKKIGMFD